MAVATLPARILFINDDRSTRLAFATTARVLGVDAVVAESGGQALELVGAGEFQIVVTDLRMPGIDGIALVERLSAVDSTLAFVLVSADPDGQTATPGRADGAISGFLHEPLDVHELHDTLVAAFALHERRKARRNRACLPVASSLLIVEDSPGDIELLLEYLFDQPGMRIVQVNCLSDAMRALHDCKFDTIITDLTLPDARGFDAVLRLQSSAPGAALLVYSGILDEALALQVVQLGAQDFLPKSMTNRESLLRALRFARERKRSELRLRRLAHYDQLTGLSNRSSFADALSHAVARAIRQKQGLAVMMIDLDGFKSINDNFGHDAGDQVLQEIAVRMRCLFREYDVVARFGGDEFAVLVTDFESNKALSDIAERLLVSLAVPIGRHGHFVTGSIGIAVFPEAGHSPGRLLRSADLAMYGAKRGGRNRAIFFEGPAPVTSYPPTSLGMPVARNLLDLAAPRLPTELEEDPPAGESGVQPIAGRQRLISTGSR